MERPRTIETINTFTSALNGKTVPHNSPENAQILGMVCGCLMHEITQALPPGESILDVKYSGLRKALDFFITGAISKENRPYFLKGREAFMRDVDDIAAGKVDPNA